MTRNFRLALQRATKVPVECLTLHSGMSTDILDIKPQYIEILLLDKNFVKKIVVIKLRQCSVHVNKLTEDLVKNCDENY